MALRWDLLELGAVDAEDATVAALVRPLSASGCTVHRRPGMSCWRIELAGDWDDYLATLGKHMRRNLRRRRTTPAGYGPRGAAIGKGAR